MVFSELKNVLRIHREARALRSERARVERQSMPCALHQAARPSRSWKKQIVASSAIGASVMHRRLSYAEICKYSERAPKSTIMGIYAPTESSRYVYLENWPEIIYNMQVV